MKILVGFVCALLCAHLGASDKDKGKDSGKAADTKTDENGKNLPPPDDVEFFILGLRHGARNPGKFLPNDKTWKTWAREGANQLTKIGKRQAHVMGKFLRGRYAKLLPEEFYPEDLKAFSASAERCQQSMQIVLAGLYPAKDGDVWNQNLLWNPIPYQIDDAVLHLRDLKCPYYDELYKGYLDGSDPGVVEWLSRNPPLVKYLSEKSGWNGTLNDLANVADNVNTMQLSNATLPDWLAKPDLAGYPPKDITADVATFGWGPRFLCMKNDECTRVTAGYYLNHVINTLKGVNNKEKPYKGRLAQIYLSNLETTSSLVKLMKAVDFTPSGDGFGYLLEMSKKGLRLFYIESDEKTPDKLSIVAKELAYCKGKDWCPLDTVIENVKANIIDNWQKVCKVPACSAKK